MKILIWVSILIGLMMPIFGKGQCSNYEPQPIKSNRVADYKMKIALDTETKSAEGVLLLTWHNTSPDTLNTLRFYMYLNAFRDLKSTFLASTRGIIFGRDINGYREAEFGKLDIHSIINEQGIDLASSSYFIQPDDGNLNDASILEVPLTVPLMPGDSIVLNIDFTAKLPRIIARAGYSKKDYFLFVHWFPQPCVYEEKSDGNWGWNSHQFMQQTEFFADFGNYDVEIKAPKELTIGATGCITAQSTKGDTAIYYYQAYDVIDFAWVAYSDFIKITDSSAGTDIELLIPSEHKSLQHRYLKAITQGLAYMEKYVGPYPYPKITVVDPPLHALASGLMEYPMLITCGSFYEMPQGIRTLESLVIHEFVHMYFMATLASNEKEEPWLDEGFVTYYEDRIMDHHYGKHSGLIELGPVISGNAENSRLEYIGMNNPAKGIIATPGYEVVSDYKGLIYSKTATVLKTLEGMIGKDLMDAVIQTYYDRFKFTHPRGTDFVNVANEIITNAPDSPFPQGVNFFFDQTIYGEGILDYKVNAQETNGCLSAVKLINTGEVFLPVNVFIAYANGDRSEIKWDGKTTMVVPDDDRCMTEVWIDKENKMLLDYNYLNNGLRSTWQRKNAMQHTLKATSFMEQLFYTLSALF